MSFVTIAVGLIAQQLTPVLWLTPDGQVQIAGQPAKYNLVAPARLVKLEGIAAWDFCNGRGALQLGDPTALRLTGSMTVSVWLKLRSYVNDGPGAQILFRGDDRCGLDPYTLVVHRDGSVAFGIQNENDLGRSVSAEVKLNRWHHVMANFDAESGVLEMWLDGKLVAGATTERRPFSNLESGWAPGVSVGNIQNDKGPHNQPLNGYVADLRLYNGVFRPNDLNVGRGNWAEPPMKNQFDLR